MPPTFSTLLAQFMRRIRASAAGVASEIGLSREAVNNWRNGDALPGRKHRDRVLACARYLRLTEVETNRLLRAAEFEPEFPAEAELPVDAAPAEAAPASVVQVFDRLQGLKPYPILMLLCPAHLGQPPERAAMLAEAQRRFGADCVLHLQPPYSLTAEPAAYFAALAAQCGLDGVDSDFAFESALARRLSAQRPLFVLVSRFEQGDPQQREVLAGILRSLSEMHSGRLFLLICGGAALADLKYQGGDLSLLNIATSERWPELSAADLLPQAQRRGLDSDAAARALRLSGGHPLLAEAALNRLATDADASDDAHIDALSGFDPLWQSLLPLVSTASARAAIGAWLGALRIGPARPYLLDPLLRGLYWANLLCERTEADGRWLQWRCEAIRRAGQQLLASSDTRSEPGA